MNFDWNKVFNMKIGEVHIIDNNSLIRRVPGGWVYTDMKGCCFIPLAEK